MNRYTRAHRTADYFRRMSELGFSCEEADKLRLIEKTLHRWNEARCGIEKPCALSATGHASFSIERDEATGKPVQRWQYPWKGTGEWCDVRYPVADREKGALRRLSAIIAAHPELWAYHQGDPRGCALYVGRWSEFIGGEHFRTLSTPDLLSQYYTRGVACCFD